MWPQCPADPLQAEILTPTLLSARISLFNVNHDWEQSLNDVFMSYRCVQDHTHHTEVRLGKTRALLKSSTVRISVTDSGVQGRWKVSLCRGILLVCWPSSEWRNDWYPHQLWMGTHPKSPSLVSSSCKVLSQHLASHPQLIGKPILDKFNAADGNLPFLFKILSIEKALSIQAHPDKQSAEILHAQYPDIYKGI